MRIIQKRNDAIKIAWHDSESNWSIIDSWAAPKNQWLILKTGGASKIMTKTYNQ